MRIDKKLCCWTGCDALLVATDAFFFARAPQLVVLAARHAIPTVYFRREFATAGGLMSYAANQNESYRLLGVYTARILKGEKPGDLPIQRSTKFKLVIAQRGRSDWKFRRRCSPAPTR
jgi:putative ABC transport system substrate-binding protein